MAEVFWNPLQAQTWYACPSCGKSAAGLHVCSDTAATPMDPMSAVRELARIALALERIANTLGDSE